MQASERFRTGQEPASRSIIKAPLRSFALFTAAVAAFVSTAGAVPLQHPLRFFEGRTETIGTMKAIMKRTHRVESIGHGTIGADGALTLVQQVRDEGEAPHQRIWHIHQVGPTQFAGTMTEASGPIVIDQVGEGYRFRFNLKGGLAAEQWLVPNRDGSSGSSVLTVRKFGMTVARSEATVRRFSQEASRAP
jgi:hypothetical protein